MDVGGLGTRRLRCGACLNGGKVPVSRWKVDAAICGEIECNGDEVFPRTAREKASKCQRPEIGKLRETLEEEMCDRECATVNGGTGDLCIDDSEANVEKLKQCNRDSFL
jgi:hypothetical protein